MCKECEEYNNTVGMNELLPTNEELDRKRVEYIVTLERERKKNRTLIAIYYQ